MFLSIYKGCSFLINTLDNTMCYSNLIHIHVNKKLTYGLVHGPPRGGTVDTKQSLKGKMAQSISIWLRKTNGQGNNIHMLTATFATTLKKTLKHNDLIHVYDCSYNSNAYRPGVSTLQSALRTHWRPLFPNPSTKTPIKSAFFFLLPSSVCGLARATYNVKHSSSSNKGKKKDKRKTSPISKCNQGKQHSLCKTSPLHPRSFSARIHSMWPSPPMHPWVSTIPKRRTRRAFAVQTTSSSV